MSTLFLETAGFYLACHPAASPAAVVKIKTVIDVCPVALSSGIRPGMSSNQAKAILNNLTVYDFKPELYLAASNQLFDHLCRFSDVVERAEWHSGYVELSRHPDPFLVALECIEDIPFDVRGSVCPCRWVAKALSPSAGLLHHPNPSRALAGQSLELLEPLAIEVRERLAFLGYRTIGEIQQLPLAVLQSQFGQAALTIRQAAYGMLHRPLQTNYPPQSIAKRLTFEGGCDNQEQLILALTRIAEALACELNESDLQCKSIELLIDTDSTVMRRQEQYAKAISSSLRIKTALLQLLSRLLSEIKATLTVSQLRVVAHQVAPSLRQQHNLQGLAQKSEYIPPQTLDQIVSKFGSVAIIPGSEIKISRRKEVLRVLRSTTGWF